MQLNEFLAGVPRLWGFLDKAEAHFASAASSEQLTKDLKAAGDRIAALETNLAEAKAEAAEQFKHAHEVEQKLTDAESKIKDLEAKAVTVDKAAGAKAAEIAASQGIPPITGDTESAASADLVAQYNAVKGNPRKKSEFIQKNLPALKSLLNIR